MLISPYLNRYVNRYAKYIDMQLFLDCNIGGQKDTFFILKKKVDVKKKKDSFLTLYREEEPFEKCLLPQKFVQELDIILDCTLSKNQMLHTREVLKYLIP